MLFYDIFPMNSLKLLFHTIYHLTNYLPYIKIFKCAKSNSNNNSVFFLLKFSSCSGEITWNCRYVTSWKWDNYLNGIRRLFVEYYSHHDEAILITSSFSADVWDSGKVWRVSLGISWGRWLTNLQWYFATWSSYISIMFPERWRPFWLW